MTLGLAPLADVANAEKLLPREFMDEAGNYDAVEQTS